jgi:hypothetical protein
VARSTVRQRENYRTALVATGIWLGVGAGLDAYLVATHKECVITDILRTKPGMAIVGTLFLHVLNCLGPVDPFRYAAKTIGNKFPVSILTDASPDQ